MSTTTKKPNSRNLTKAGCSLIFRQLQAGKRYGSAPKAAAIISRLFSEIFRTCRFERAMRPLLERQHLLRRCFLRAQAHDFDGKKRLPLNAISVTRDERALYHHRSQMSLEISYAKVPTSLSINYPRKWTDCKSRYPKC